VERVSGGTDWLAHSARAAAAHTALEIGDLRFSYGRLHARSAAVACWLRSRDIRPGSVVATLLRNGVAFVELMHATAACGATLLPLNTRATAYELAPQLTLARARLLIYDEGPLAETALASAAQSKETSAAILPTPAADVEIRNSGEIITEQEAASNRPLAILFTSGTTGPAKGAMLTHENFRASALASAAHLGVNASDRWLACMPLYHVGGISILLRATLFANTVVLQERFDPDAVNEAFDRGGITCASLVPTMLARILEARGDRPAPKSLRYVLLGGGPAPSSLLARARALAFPIAPTYGLTEATSQVATRAPDPDAGAAIGGLAPLPGYEIRVLDEAGRIVSAGCPGELWIRGPSVMQRYIGRPAETAEVLRDGWLRTGDFGVRARDGTLTILDRRSDLILSGGENIYPAEVEAVLAEHPAIAEAAVAASYDEDLGQRPAAWLVFRGESRPDAEALREFCRERLAGYKVPVAYHAVPALPRTPSGKLQRRQLAAPIGNA
jgi:O-succinylbenzoic acid--CoA ligase